MFNANRKGVELTMNVIVMSAIALLVLLVLAFFLMRGFGGFNEKTTCEYNAGSCVATNTACPDDKPMLSGWTCTGKTKSKCCVAAIGG